MYDSSVYIQSWRDRQIASDAFSSGDPTTNVADKPVYLSSVVLQELYVGGLDKHSKKEIATLEEKFRRLGRLITPNLSDWIITGQILSKIGQKYGFELVKLSRMTNDCLIAVSARRESLEVVTLNTSDFQKISEFRPFTFKIL